MAREEEEPLAGYQDIEGAWNVKAKFAYNMLDIFDKAWELLESAEKKNRITPAKHFISNRIFKPMRIYLIDDEALEIKAQIDSEDCVKMSEAMITLWGIFAIDMGHIIPKKKEHKLSITDRYKSIRMKTNEKDKKRASSANQ